MRARIVAGAAALAAALGTFLPVPTAAAAGPDDLYLVTLEGPAATGPLGRVAARAEQDAVLATVGSPAPVYRWTTALNGVAVRLDPADAAALARNEAVALVERDTVRPLAGLARPATGVPGLPRRTAGGAGTVIGVVDTGIAPESAVFSGVGDLGREPADFAGECVAGEAWSAEDCSEKVVGARWFVDGFGADRIRSEESLSARDRAGHGSQVASIAAGNAGIAARVGGRRLGTYAGVAPQARLAVYKACWTAPDPADDGCSTADLVSAIDSATADRVDVLNLAVGGPAEFDTVERALLGAAESGVAVVAAAGNAAGRTAGHPSPWVTTVGASAGPVRRGEVRLPGGRTFAGAMAAARGVESARLVLAADVPAADATRRRARVCTPGSLDAARVAGRIVLCERGAIARVDKSAAVARADGVGMVLANTGRGSVAADFHSVPTVHLAVGPAREVRRWAAAHPRGRIALVPLGADRAAPKVARWSRRGDPEGPVVKPDLVATGSGVVGAVPGGWDLASGTSVAAAITSGAAALLVSRHPDWTEAAVRSALATTARRLPGAAVLAAGAGRVVPDPSARVGLVYDVAPGDYRAWLSAALPGDLNTPSVLLGGTAEVAQRTVTNVTGRTATFLPRTTGFERHDVEVSPASLRLGPGESGRFTITVGRTSVPQPDDDGWVTWRGSGGTVTRIPVLITR
ncbi:hypothetical protein GCM10027062_41400 [Nocardioides hungaricus]